MIFTVPENFKGSFVLRTLNKAFHKGMTVSIDEVDLSASDVKSAIRQGLLVPVDGRYNEDKANLENEVFVVNKMDKTLILDKFVIKKDASIIISVKESKLPVIIAAQMKGYIDVLSQISTVDKKEEKENNIEENNTQQESIDEDLSKDVTVEKESAVSLQEGKILRDEDKEAKPVVWDFLKQKSEEAQSIPNASRLDIPDDSEDPEEIKNETPKQSVKSEDKALPRNKKGNKSKNRNNKASKVKPVGTVKPEKEAGESIIELDSRGNPVSKASDAFQHFIDGLTEEKEQE